MECRDVVCPINLVMPSKASQRCYQFWEHEAAWAVYTNKNCRPVDALLERLAIRRHFAVVDGGHTIAATQRPDSRMLQHALGGLSVLPNQAFMVGDGISSIKSGPGIECQGHRLSVRFSRQPETLDVADGLIDRFVELLAMVDRLS